MFNKLIYYKKNITKINNKIYTNKKILSPNLNKNYYIFNGIIFIKRNFNELFIKRNIKFNIFFKKPLVKPSKKIKK